ncbi:MAG: ABC transporter permease [Phycisphaerae bacterium]
MIGTILQLSWTNLARDRVAQVLTFVLPVIFFSIFAVVFGEQERAMTRKLEVALVDEDQSETSRRIFETLKRDKSLDVRLTHPRDGGGPIDRTVAEQMIKEGRMPAAIIFPKGFGENFGGFVGGGAAIDLLADRSDPVAPQMLNGLLQKTAMTAAPDLMINRGLDMFRKYAGGLTDAQQAAMDLFLPQLRGMAAGGAESKPTTGTASAGGAKSREESAPAIMGLISVNMVDVLNTQSGIENSPAIAFYAAGTAVMFLLFSAAGAGGTLLDEQESGTIDRLLSSQLGMTQLLLGKWIFLAIMGFVQVSVMFVWGWLVFGLQLFTPLHLSGFVVMTALTASAAAAFGLSMATICRSRAQLSGLSTTLILIMSAVGGSMFPRFLMPESMKTAGLFTFNAWALDGYQKVFWYNRTIPELWQQMSVLAMLTVVFLVVARLVARRWEAV